MEQDTILNLEKLGPVSQIFAMDIGGSLTKIAYYSTVPHKKIVYDKDPPDIDTEGQQIEVGDRS